VGKSAKVVKCGSAAVAVDGSGDMGDFGTLSQQYSQDADAIAPDIRVINGVIE
jgi:hypothetical protein